ncbi:crossover junction endodeoxyribonuclease RuvC [Candidatus Nardonella dryophthoridicola]|uniref:Crossover junction endodeoxyribonuclease RuvC n=1 Tax=endosymbiont of Rhynchophorus ferrugineus TaxID=1972133 RepID=A0A2Z5T438_9GAMM|nr:crossover junction endodeoxyribonuclease RuvC [Candidatus Nardonella dryophthoridicola]QTJ62884.1 crossover junction endodeoxyribonuclease RuvC [Candidatus Nardonella dryophthoridicola]BBA85130.1 crossover junction endodeoxyribonuclease RuvC [endosymbiont of Rhynchophorus ferrugineus]
MNIILSIDPGYLKTGFSIIKENSNKIFYLKYGIINSKEFVNKFEKMKFIYNEINKIILKFKPKVSIIESIFLGKNFDSIIKLDLARSSIILSLINKNIPIYEYNSKKVKKIITNFGNCNKNLINKKIINIFNIKNRLSYDESDAIAIGLAYLVDKFNFKI